MCIVFLYSEEEINLAILRKVIVIRFLEWQSCVALVVSFELLGVAASVCDTATYACLSARAVFYGRHHAL